MQSDIILIPLFLSPEDQMCSKNELSHDPSSMDVLWLYTLISMLSYERRDAVLACIIFRFINHCDNERMLHQAILMFQQHLLIFIHVFFLKNRERTFNYISVHYNNHKASISETNIENEEYFIMKWIKCDAHVNEWNIMVCFICRQTWLAWSVQSAFGQIDRKISSLVKGVLNSNIMRNQHTATC